MMDPLIVGPVASALVALAGLAFATIVQISSDRRQRMQRTDELFLRAMDFLGGGSQKRNLGISAIELYWADTRHKALVISLLIGSAIYLLSESEQKDAANEQYNLHRMMRLITAVRPGNLGESLRGDYEALQRVLEQKIIASSVMVAPGEQKWALHRILSFVFVGHRGKLTEGWTDFALKGGNLH
jgi:hypothetical protein